MNDKVLKAVLWLAVEDFAGLWETIWEVKPLLKDASDGKIKTVAASVVRDLFGKGWIEFYLAREPDGEMERLPADQTEKVLRDPKNWTTPTPGSTSVRISATESGRNQVLRRKN